MQRTGVLGCFRQLLRVRQRRPYAVRRLGFHIDSAFGRDHEPDARRFGVDGQAHIGFVRKVYVLLDAETMDRLAVHRGATRLAMMRAASSSDAAL